MTLQERIKKINNWVDERNPREKFFLLGLGIAFIYFFWSFLLSTPLLLKKKDVEEQIKALTLQRSAAKQQLTAMKDVVASKTFKAILNQQKQLSGELQKTKEKLSTLSSAFISVEDIPKLTKDILGLRSPSVSLSGLKSLPAIPWVPPSDEKDILPKNLYQYKIEVEITSDYFNTIEYLEKLQNLHWRLYWDSLQYKVQEYPKANITLDLYVLSTEKAK